MRRPSPSPADIDYALARAQQERPAASPAQTVDVAWTILNFQYDAAAIDEAAIESAARRLKRAG